MNPRINELFGKLVALHQLEVEDAAIKCAITRVVDEIDDNANFPDGEIPDPDDLKENIYSHLIDGDYLSVAQIINHFY